MALLSSCILNTQDITMMIYGPLPLSYMIYNEGYA